MKKTLFTLMMLVLTTICGWAQRWVAPDKTQYPDETPIYVHVTTNGTENVRYDIAAFIGDECRAVGQQQNIGNKYCYTLRVVGNQSDMGKDITFKMVYNGLVYKFKKTAKFDGETDSRPIPFELALEPISGIELPEKIEMTHALPFDYDLNDDIKLVYKDNSGKTFEPTGTSEVDETETPLTYKWDFTNSSAYFTVNGNNILHAIKATSENGMYLGLNLLTIEPETAGHGEIIHEVGSAFTNVVVSEPTIPVTSFSMTKTEFEFWEGEEAFFPIQDAAVILPEDATDKSLDIVVKDVTTFNPFPNGIANMRGTYTLVVSPKSAADGVNPIEVKVVVKRPALDIKVEPMTMTVNKGTDVFAAIRNNITINTENCDETVEDLTIRSLRVYDASQQVIEPFPDGIATLVGGPYEVLVESSHALKPVPVIVQVTVINPVTKIECQDVLTFMGQGVNLAEAAQIKVFPEDASDKEFEFIFEGTGDVPFLDGHAVHTGIFPYTVVSKDGNASASLIVYVVNVTQVNNVRVICKKPWDTGAKFKFEPFPSELFDASKLSMEFDNAYISEHTPEFVFEDNTAYIEILGKKTGPASYILKYDGQEIYGEKMDVHGAIPFNNTWNWITPLGAGKEEGVSITDDYGIVSAMIEIRSQEGLLYNDPEIGLFGNISNFNDEYMYKVKTNEQFVMTTVFKADYFNMSNAIGKGYTWMTYGGEDDRTINQIKAEGGSFNVGDKILSINSFAEYTSNGWVPADFRFKEGCGYMYYRANGQDGGFSINYGDVAAPDATETTQAKGKHTANVWQYETGEYADNMAIVAELRGVPATSNYSIGAFVGDECRGMGEFAIADRMFINVAGKPGEKVSFRLHDSQTGKVYDITETMQYGGIQGTVNKPVALTAGTVTGIMDIVTPDTDGAEATYDLSGRMVNASANGIVIIKNGDKVQKICK